MLTKILSMYRHLGKDTHEVLQGASIAFVFKLLAAAAAFVFNIALTRILGAEQAGLYFIALTVVAVTATVGQFGLDNTLLRFTAARVAADDWESVNGLYRKGMVIAMFVSCLSAATLFFTAPLVANKVFSKPELSGLIRLMAAGVVPFALFTLHAQMLRGLKKIWQFILVAGILPPIFSTLSVIILAPSLGVSGAALAYIISAVITLVIILGVWRRACPQVNRFSKVFSTKLVLQSCIPLLILSILTIMTGRCSVFLLGVWASNADVAIFSVAQRTAMLMTFILNAVNSIAAPKFAALHSVNNIIGMQKIFQNSVGLMTLIGSPLLLLCLFTPVSALRLFGTEFVGGAVSLSVMAVGQFISLSMGSVGYLLTMTGHENIMRNISILCLLMNLALNIMLIPIAGVTGAAIATAATIIIKNIIAAVMVKKRLNITILPKMTGC